MTATQTTITVAELHWGHTADNQSYRYITGTYPAGTLVRLTGDNINTWIVVARDGNGVAAPASYDVSIVRLHSRGGK